MAPITEEKRQEVRDGIRRLRFGSLSVADVDVADDDNLENPATLVTVRLRADRDVLDPTDFFDIRSAARARAWDVLGDDREVRVVYVSTGDGASDDVADDVDAAPGDKHGAPRAS